MDTNYMLMPNKNCPSIKAHAHTHYEAITLSMYMHMQCYTDIFASMPYPKQKVILDVLG